MLPPIDEVKWPNAARLWRIHCCIEAIKREHLERRARVVTMVLSKPGMGDVSGWGS